MSESKSPRDWLLARAARISDARWRASFLSAIPEHVQLLDLAGEWLDAPR